MNNNIKLIVTVCDIVFDLFLEGTVRHKSSALKYSKTSVIGYLSHDTDSDVNRQSHNMCRSDILIDRETS